MLFLLGKMPIFEPLSSATERVPRRQTCGPESELGFVSEKVKAYCRRRNRQILLSVIQPHGSFRVCYGERTIESSQAWIVRVEGV